MPILSDRPLASSARRRPRTPTLGVVAGAGRSGAALQGLGRAIAETEFVTSLVRVPALGPEALVEAVRRLRDAGVEGVVVVAPPRGAMDALATLAESVPLVAVEAARRTGVAVAAIDHYGGAVAATAHLLELGHDTVVHVAGPADRRDAALRLAGWRDALLAAGAEPAPALEGDGSPQAGFEIGRRLADAREVTAIFAGGDRMAIGLLHALHAAGRRVPGEVSVVGCGAIAEGEFLSPPLTSVRHDCLALGRAGVELLRAQIEAGEPMSAEVRVPAPLQLRASSAPRRPAA